VVWFDGPLSPARIEAARAGFRVRIKPITSQHPGLVQGWVLFPAERQSAAVLTLTTSLETLEAIGQAINSTALLPGEDPALLTGPDRIDIHRVRAAALTGLTS
jgi:hypothetical protein